MERRLPLIVWMRPHEGETVTAAASVDGGSLDVEAWTKDEWGKKVN